MKNIGNSLDKGNLFHQI